MSARNPGLGGRSHSPLSSGDARECPRVGACEELSGGGRGGGGGGEGGGGGMPGVRLGEPLNHEQKALH